LYVVCNDRQRHLLANVYFNIFWKTENS